MADKLIKGIDEQLWNKFVAFCKIKNVRIASELEKLINLKLNAELKHLFDKKWRIKYYYH